MGEILSELIEKCRRGDAKAVETLVRRFRPWALSLARAMMDDLMLAEDVVQEAFVSAISALGELRAPEAFPGWLRRIVRRQASALLSKKRDASLDDHAVVAQEPRTFGICAERNELRAIVRNALDTLPTPEREAAVRFYIEQLSCLEISSALAVPLGTVKRRLFDARARLRDMLLGYVCDTSVVKNKGQSSRSDLPF